MTRSAEENGKPAALHRTPPRSEEELLEREEASARSGLLASTHAFGEDLLRATDLRSHIERHPVAVLTAGAVGGILLARPVIGLVTNAAGRRALVGAITNIVTRFASLKLLGSAISAFVPNGLGEDSRLR